MSRLLGILVLLGLTGCPPRDCVYGEQRDPTTGECFLRCPGAELGTEDVRQLLKKPDAMLRGVYGVRQENVLTIYVVGEEGTVLRWSDDRWESVGAPNWRVLWNGVWAAGPEDVWVAGTGGELWRRVGMGWESYTSTLNVPGVNLLSISGSTDVRRGDTILIGAEGGWARGKNAGGGWVWSRTLDLRSHYGVAVYGEEHWLMGKGVSGSFVERPGGPAWQGLPGLDIARSLLRVADAAWVIGQGQSSVLRLDRTNWVGESMPVPFQAYGIGGKGERDLWVVGSKGAILRGDARAARPEDRWVQVTNPARDTLNAIWVDSQGCGVWIVGDKGTVLRIYSRWP